MPQYKVSHIRSFTKEACDQHIVDAANEVEAIKQCYPHHAQHAEWIWEQGNGVFVHVEKELV